MIHYNSIGKKIFNVKFGIIYIDNLLWIPVSLVPT